MKRLIQILALYVLLVMLVACQSAPVPAVSPTASIPTLPDGTLVIRNGTVIDGTGVEPILNGLVAIKGGQIIAVGAEAQFRIPQDAQVIDAQGGSILPGFIDAQTGVGQPHRPSQPNERGAHPEPLGRHPPARR